MQSPWNLGPCPQGQGGKLASKRRLRARGAAGGWRLFVRAATALALRMMPTGARGVVGQQAVATSSRRAISMFQRADVVAEALALPGDEELQHAPRFLLAGAPLKCLTQQPAPAWTRPRSRGLRLGPDAGNDNAGEQQKPKLPFRGQTICDT